MIIDRKRIEEWGDMPEAKSGMAELVTQLVMNSLPNGAGNYNIPIGSSTFVGGWDGYIESANSFFYIPAGRSGWEFGAVGDFRGKAESDYKKRSSEIPDNDKQQMTFIFVTPFFWEKKQKWVDKKNKEGKWRDVRVYDSDTLSQWIYQNPIVVSWFAKKIGLSFDNGIVLPEDQWKEISVGRNGVRLTPLFYTAGRERLVNELREIINGKPCLRAYKAPSREEAMAFVIAAGMSLPEPEKSKFLGKTVVVESRDSFRSLAKSLNSINIVTHLEDNSAVYWAADKNIVLVALGPEDDFSQDVTSLPISDKHALVGELVSYGISEPEANRIVLSNSCSLNLIRKELGFPPVGAKWVGDDDCDLIPALLLGRWNENFEADINLLTANMGGDWKKYQVCLEQWLKKSVSPLTKTGPVWRLTSPLMLWTVLSSRLDENTFSEIEEDFKEIFVIGKEKYSDQIKKGILQTLIIIALYGNRLRLPIGNSQEWADNLIKQLLHNSDPQKWLGFSDYLPLIAEVSPVVFVQEVELAIRERKPVISVLFEEGEGLFSPESHHTSLLWALEALAWHPDYLESVTRIFLQLTELDPGGRLANRPFNSLVDIYLAWMPHTSVGLDGRLSILDKCLKSGFPDMWRLLIALLPHSSSVTSGTYKLKWRDYEFTDEQNVTNADIYKTTEWIVSRLIDTFDGNDHNLASLIEKMEPIYFPLRNRLIMWLPSAVDKIQGTRNETRKALRETLWYQNLSGIKERCSLNDAETASVREAYEHTIPLDAKERNSWLFDESFPHLPEKSDCPDDDEFNNIKQVKKCRIEACKELLDLYGEDEVIAMRDKVREPQIFGDALASFDSERLTTKICNLLGEPKDSKFSKGYLSAYEQRYGDETVHRLFKTCKDNGFNNDRLTALLLCFEQNRKLWNFVETLDNDIQIAYWQQASPFFWGGYKEDVTLYKLEKLSSVGRGLDAMNDAWIYADEIPTKNIENLLNGVLSSIKGLNGSLDHHPLSEFMEQLHERDDADKNLLLTYEWIFLPVLRYDYKDTNFTLMNQRLCADPDFVVEVLGYLYKQEDDEPYSEDEPTPEKQANALRAFYLFNQWKDIPGVNEDKAIDEKILSEWMQSVFDKAIQSKQFKHACSRLGELFSHYPEWTDEAEKLFAVMQTVEEKTFFDSYSVGLFNKRGYTTRGPYEGGEIERDNASAFKKLYDKYHKHYPRVAKVFKDLSEQYERMAKDMDAEADISKLDY